MRMDVKVGLILGVAAILLGAWLYWPESEKRSAVTVTEADGLAEQPAGPSGRGADAPRIEPLVRPNPQPRPAAPNQPAPAAEPRSSAGRSSVAMEDAAGREQPAPVVIEPPAVDVADGPVDEPLPAQPRVPEPSATALRDQGAAAPIVPVIPEPVATDESVGVAAIGREPLTHVVMNGQDLARVAELYYGDGSGSLDVGPLVKLLRQANPQLGDRPVRAGMKIRIPALPSDAVAGAGRPAATDRTALAQPTPAAPVRPEQQPAPAAGRTYTVKKGDTLYSIATQELGRGSRWPELLELNNDMLNGKPERLRPGQVLQLPG